VAGVEELREEPASDGIVSVVTRSATGDPVRRAMADLVVRSGWGLLEIRPLPMSLEDLFVRLVRDDRDAA
jgi:hypothetical protein